MGALLANSSPNQIKIAGVLPSQLDVCIVLHTKFEFSNFISSGIMCEKIDSQTDDSIVDVLGATSHRMGGRFDPPSTHRV